MYRHKVLTWTSSRNQHEGNAATTPATQDKAVEMTTIHATTMSAQYQVFTTTELLECILLHLGAQTLLLSQRVNKNFHQTIRGSCLLRQKLWLEPGDGDHDVENPILSTLALRPRINPLLSSPWIRQHCHSHIGRIEFGEPDTSGGIGFLASVLRIICRKGVSFQEMPRASWRDMVVVSNHESYFQFRIMRHSPENGDLLLWQLVFFERSPTAGGVGGVGVGEAKKSKRAMASSQADVSSAVFSYGTS